MGLLDVYKSQINEYFSDWIKINDKRTTCGWTIEDFPLSPGVDENLTEPHCWKCVSVNQCWFKNEEEKKPEHFDYSKYTYNQIPKSTRGLYHPNCHCKEKPINVPRIKDIELIIKEEKINFFFKDKVGLFYSWGYTNKDKDSFIEMYKNLVIDAYRRGNYEYQKHERSGYQINLLISFNGKNDKRFNQYNMRAAFVVFPNGKLICVTPIGGWK